MLLIHRVMMPGAAIPDAAPAHGVSMVAQLRPANPVSANPDRTMSNPI